MIEIQSRPTPKKGEKKITEWKNNNKGNLKGK
jgi:hypothetical protein